MQIQVPGSAKLRALVEPFIETGVYPQAHELTDAEADSLNEKDRSLLVELYELAQQEDMVGIPDQVPQKGSEWANIREKICLKVGELLDSRPDLIVVDFVQLHAIDKGAVPDPNEDSKMKFFRLPDWNFACWACGSEILVKGDKPYCPSCDRYELFWPYGGQGEDVDDVALLLNGFAKRCTSCKRPTKNKYLKDGKCPVCRGTTAQEPGRKNYGTNGGIRCDTDSGPCACGAWH